MQSNIEIADGEITGTLKYVTDYSDFSNSLIEQSGNYLALHITSPDADRITVELVNGGNADPVEVGEDGIAVIRITDETTQTVKITVYEGHEINYRTFGLSGLTLAEE